MTHIDLFSGIGGFALATEIVWGKMTHIFVEYDPFCQAILKKHWPEAQIHGDIRQFIADTKNEKQHMAVERKSDEENTITARPYILTGGFPCQPFSHAGRRKGTADDRYLWPEMLETITLLRPEWVIAENVAGLVTWDDGVVLETVCADLEREDYEVQPFVIPACAVGAPHRRDRVWIVAHAKDSDDRGDSRKLPQENERQAEERQKERAAKLGGTGGADAPDTRRARWGERPRQGVEPASEEPKWKNDSHRDWDTPWIEVATRLCRVDYGLPRRLDRNPRLKALGNAIVPQVAAEIMRAIKQTAV